MESWNRKYIELYDPYQKKGNEIPQPLVQTVGTIYSGITEIDQALGGLDIGKVTAFVGKSTLLSTLLHRICVKTYEMYHSPTVVLDAGNQLNPYILARFARLQKLSEQEILQQIYLSRAYTVYQLNSLIHRHVEPLIQQVKPVTVLLTGLFSLCSDADVPAEDASELSLIVMENIKQIATKYHLAMILIDRKQDGYHFPEIDSLIDTAIHVKDMRLCPRITIAQQNKQVTVTSETFGQLCLSDFGMVI